MRNTIIIAAISLLFVACKKSTFSTKPSLKYESANATELRVGDVLEMRLTFTDAEGDLVSDSALFVEQFSTFCTATYFKSVYPLEPFPTSTNLEGTILVKFGYRALPSLKEPQCGETDTCFFRFALRDKEKNVSDTIISEPIILIKE